MDRKKTAALAAKARRGDKAAFEELYNGFADKVFFFAKRSTGSADAARDITSETFVTALEHISELRSDESFVGWLYAIAYSKCAANNREASRSEHFGSDEDMEKAVSAASLSEPIMLPEDYVSNKELCRLLKGIIDGLPPELRSAVILYYYEDMSVAEVARSLGIKENSAKHKLFRARSVIRKKIEKLTDSGALLSAVPLESLLHNTADASFEHASAAGAARVAGRSFAVKVIAAGTAAAVALGVPVMLRRMRQSSYGDYRPEDSSLSVTVPDDGAEYISVSRLQSDADAALSKKYDHLRFREGISVSVPQELFKRSFLQAGGMEERYEEIFSKLFDSDTLSQAEIEHIDNVTAGIFPDVRLPCAGFHDDGLKVHCYMLGNGFLFFFRPSAYEDIDTDPAACLKRFDPDRTAGLDEVLQLEGGSITVGEAADYIRQWISESYAYLEPDFDFDILSLRLCEDSTGDPYLEAVVGKSIGGVGLDSIGSDITAGTTRRENIANTVIIKMKRPFEISLLNNPNGMLIPDRAERIDKALPLSAVLERIDRQLDGTVQIDSIRLKYTLTPQCDDLPVESYISPGTPVTGRLVWELRCESGDDTSPPRYFQAEM